MPDRHVPPGAGGNADAAKAPDAHSSDDPYRYRRGWSGRARLSATNRLRVVTEDKSGLLPVAEAAAEVIRKILVARRVSVTLLEGDEYRDLVNVGDLAPDQARFPKGQRYPTSDYPATTASLRVNRGYISTSGDLDVVREYIALSPRPTFGCFMGVPIIAFGAVQGEVFATRDPHDPVFLDEDMEVARDLATSFGTRLPDLVRQQHIDDPSW